MLESTIDAHGHRRPHRTEREREAHDRGGPTRTSDATTSWRRRHGREERDASRARLRPGMKKLAGPGIPVGVGGNQWGRPAGGEHAMACRTGSAATATGCKLDAMPTTPSLLPMEERHWPHVRAIYLEGIATLQATFETTAPESWAAWSASKLDVGRTVAVDDEGVCGWTTLARVSARPVYAGVAEVTVYVATRVRGRGVGRTLMAKLVADSEAACIWTLESSIFPE